jgi:hypothetical protein
VWGPLPRGVTILQALEGGQDGIMFLDALLGEPHPGAVRAARARTAASLRSIGMNLRGLPTRDSSP